MAQQILEDIKFQGSVQWFNFVTMIRQEVQDVTAPFREQFQQADFRAISMQKHIEKLQERVDLLSDAIGIAPLEGEKKRNQFDELRDLIVRNTTRLKEDIVQAEIRVENCVNICDAMLVKMDSVTSKMNL